MKELLYGTALPDAGAVNHATCDARGGNEMGPTGPSRRQRFVAYLGRVLQGLLGYITTGSRGVGRGFAGLWRFSTAGGRRFVRYLTVVREILTRLVFRVVIALGRYIVTVCRIIARVARALWRYFTSPRPNGEPGRVQGWWAYFYDSKFWRYVAIGYFVAGVSMALLWYVVGEVTLARPIFGLTTCRPWLTELGFLIGYTLFSWRIVGEEEIAAKILLGARVQDLGAGLAFVPLLICWLRVEESKTHQMEFPAEPQNIWYEATAPPDAIKRPPIRVTSGGSSAADVADPLDRRITLEVTYFVRLRVISLCQFLEVVGSFEHAFQQIEDEVNPIIQEEFAHRTPGKILEELPDINKKVNTAVRALVSATPEHRAWGVAIEGVNLKSPDITKKVNEALRDVPAAALKAQATIAAAHGEAESYRINNEQIAAMRELFLTREGTGLQARFARLLQALNVTDPAHAIAILQSDQAIEALKEAENVTIVGGGVANLYGLVQSLVQGVQQQPSGGTQAPPALPAPPAPPASTQQP